jgi:hypothetical protein
MIGSNWTLIGCNVISQTFKAWLVHSIICVLGEQYPLLERGIIMLFSLHGEFFPAQSSIDNSDNTYDDKCYYFILQISIGYLLLKMISL